MFDNPFVLLAMTLAFVLAGMVKGVVGMGLPTVAMGVLGLFMAPAAAATLLILPSLVTNVWQLAAGPAFGALARRLAGLLAGLVAGTFMGIGVLTGASSALPSAALGAVLAVYGVIGLAAPQFTVPARLEAWLSPPIGLATGLVAGATGVFVIPAVPYLASLGLAREALIQALGLCFTVSTLALALALGLSAPFPPALAALSLLAVVPALAGLTLGRRVRGKLRPEVFRRWFFTGLVVLGLTMLARALVAR